MKASIKRTVLWTVAGIVLVAAIVAGTGLYVTRGNCLKSDREIFVPTGSSYSALLDSIGRDNLRFRWAFDRYARRIGLDRNVKGGHYVLSAPMDIIELARKLNLGEQTPVNVTINNVKTPAYLAGKLSRQIEADSASILAVLTDSALAVEMGFDTVTMFSMFIPNTYEFYWTVSPEQFVRRMHKEYEAFWNGDRDAKRQRSGLSRLETMTLASIIYEETRQKDEMPTIAGVYMNRLRKGIKLQADPTVKYALGDFGLRRILYSHLKVDSPYNTYRYAGLPPSPICMPSIDAIDAALNYEDHDYIFFCARPTFDGYHNFAATSAQHAANARAYQAELNKRKIYK